jgi:hypothetical protein
MPIITSPPNPGGGGTNPGGIGTKPFVAPTLTTPGSVIYSGRYVTRDTTADYASPPATSWGSTIVPVYVSPPAPQPAYSAADVFTTIDDFLNQYWFYLVLCLVAVLIVLAVLKG